jgi:uncharacterized protein
MSISMYKASAPIFVQFLTSLSAVLDKAAGHAEAKKIDPAVLLNARLYPDMFPLVRQVREATNHAANACGRLAGADLLTFANTEASIPELKERIAKTIDFIKGLKPAQIDGAQIHWTTLAAEFQSTQLLFSLHHRLRYFASSRRRACQTRLYRHPGHSPIMGHAKKGACFWLMVAPGPAAKRPIAKCVAAPNDSLPCPVDWQAWARLKVTDIVTPMSFHNRVALDFPVSLGGYRNSGDPAERMMLMVHVSGAPNSLPPPENLWAI